MASNTKSVKKLSETECFYKQSSARFGWKDLSGDLIMDIGCGSGKSSSTFIELFPDIQKLIAIDHYKRNIEGAQANNPHEKIEYEVADIKNPSTLKQWQGKISKAISTYYFNTVKNKGAAFKSLWYLLQDGGEAALLIKLYGPLDELMEEICRNEEWSSFLPPISEILLPECFRKMSKEGYRSVATIPGFEVVSCVTTQRVYVYDSEEEFKTNLFGFIPIIESMSPMLQRKFKDYMAEFFLQVNPKTDDGKFCIRNNVLSLLLRKKKINQKFVDSKFLDMRIYPIDFDIFRYYRD